MNAKSASDLCAKLFRLTFGTAMVSLVFWGKDGQGILVAIGAFAVAVLWSVVGLVVRIYSRQPYAYEGSILLGCLALGLSLLLPAIKNASMTCGRLPCPSNLRQIGVALMLHNHDHPGPMPASLTDLATVTEFSLEALRCPDSGDRPAPKGQPPVCSYVYYGAGIPLSGVPYDVVIARDALTNHQNEGVNALFGDGHVEWVNCRVVDRLITVDQWWRQRTTAATRPATTQP